MDVYWLEQVAEDVPEDDEWLGPGEKQILAGLRFAPRRADWRLGRWTAKHAVSAYLKNGYALPEIEIRAAASGAPYVVVREAPAGVAISLSHRSGTAACAVGPFGSAIGCDLETVEERANAFVADFFAERERELVAGLSGHWRALMIALIWSAKESALKVVKEGLRLDTRLVTVVPESGPGVWQALSVSFPACTLGGWWRQQGDLVRTLVTAPKAGPPSAVREFSKCCR